MRTALRRVILAVIVLPFLSLSAFSQTTLTPSTLSFGNQVLNVASASKTATLKNTQTVPLTISSITISGGTAAGDYAWGGNCPISPNTLGSGKSCNITVVLTPSALGSRTATLTVTHSATTSPQSVSLTGTAVEPAALSTPSLNYGAVAVGNTSAIKTVILTNYQKTALTFSSVAASGNFAIASSTCGGSINAGANCTIGVTFSPTTTGAQTATLTFTDSAANSPQTVNLSGTGFAPVTLSAGSLTFASQTVGTASVAKTVTLFNHLNTALSISLPAASGDFGVASNTCGSSVPAVQKCTLGVTFSPTEVGARTGSLTISYGAYGSPSTVVLTGTGNVNGLKTITVTPGNPSIPLGTMQQFTATGYFTNGSSENLTTAVTWNSSAAATITPAGVATGVSQGNATITASVNSISGMSTLTVNAPALVSIAVTPANPSISGGSTEQFSATGTYTDNSTQNLTSTATWSSSATNFATINTSGLATAMTPGNTTIQAASGTISGSTALTVTAGFVVTGNLNSSRWLHTATVLDNGAVLIIGGDGGCCISGADALASAELYSAATGSFVPTGSLNNARESHSATLLNNGTVLVAGGDASGASLTSSELYNPVTATFSTTGSLNTARYNHTATSLNSGMVLVAGGQDSSGNPLASAELYNPATGGFTPTGSMAAARYFHTATLLSNGMVLVAGGFQNGGPIGDAELYNPATGTFAETGSLNLSRAFHIAVLLNTGQVLVAGGDSDTTGPTPTAELYDPTTGTFTTTGAMSTARLWHTATLLNDGKVLVAGGSADTQCCILAGAEVFDPTTQAFSLTGSLNQGRVFHSSVLLNTGTVLTIGGLNGGSFNTTTPPPSTVLSSAELYHPDTLVPPNLVSVAVTPASPSIPLDTAQQFIATGTFSDNSTQQLASVTWSTSDPTIAEISNDASNSGNAYMIASTGSTTVSACTGSVCGSTSLTAATAALVSIAVTPASGSVPAGLTQQFDAVGTYSDGGMQDITNAVAWSSSATSVATINTSGLATGVMTGNSTTITATLGAINGSTSLIVTAPVLSSIAVTPANPSILAGYTDQFTATGMYSDGSIQNLTASVTWASSAISVATINATGFATGTTQGATTISASLNAVSGTTNLTVTAPALVSIAVSPANPAIPVGTTEQFTATGTYSDGSMQDLTSTASWTSTATSVATINAAGLSSSATQGSTSISATVGAIAGNTMLTVSAPLLASIAVTPANPSIAAGSNEQFTATGTYTDGSMQNLTGTATWDSSTTKVATISATGLASAVYPGQTSIQASLGNVTGETLFTVSGGFVPSTYFGMHVGNSPSTLPGFPLAVSYGNYRFWDTTASWQNAHICNSNATNCLADPVTNTSLNSTVMDGILATLLSAGITDNVMYTNARVPLWAQGTAPHSYPCLGGASACILPDQMNQDGSCSGANSQCTIIDSWFHLIASHVNDSTFLTTHAHIKYWEPWNEFSVDSTIGGGPGEINATWAQLLRITEDMRCIIKGVGTIHNYPSAGQSDTCADYLSVYNWTAADPNAIITTPSIPKSRGHIGPLLNFLYCNNKPYLDLGSATTCTWSGGLNWGSSAVDAINVHCYWTDITPETVGSDIEFIRSKLNSVDVAKPFLDGESSGGAENQLDHIWNDDTSYGGGIVRQLAILWSHGVPLMWEYTYGAAAPSTTYDALYTASNGLTQLGVGWNTGYAWLNGAVPLNHPFCSASGTVWTCQMILANGSPAQLTWDSQYGPGGTSGPVNCSSAPVPTICGSTIYSVPAQYTVGWTDITNVQHPYSATVTIGAIPILLQ